LFKELRSLFARGSFGEKVFIEGKYLYGRWEKLEVGWRGREDYSITLGGLIHIVDLVCFITDNYVYDSCLTTGRITSKNPKIIHDYANIRLQSRHLGVANLSTNFSAEIAHRRDFAIFGDLGSVEVRGNQVWASVPGLSYIEKLDPTPSRGTLITEFISRLEGSLQGTSYPSTTQILNVLNLCLGKNSS